MKNLVLIASISLSSAAFVACGAEKSVEKSSLLAHNNERTCANFSGNYHGLCTGSRVGEFGPNQFKLNQTACSGLNFEGDTNVFELQDTLINHSADGFNYSSSWDRNLVPSGRHLRVNIFTPPVAGVILSIKFNFAEGPNAGKSIKRVTSRSVPALGGPEEVLETCDFTPIP